ncbi:MULTISPECIES: pseudoazurin [Caulobacter]|jgi:pseudoazurin|uniref:Pseudoazurin n=2 Tax=root TaxID=1 RepID=R0EIT0_CAUVI|nr:MULTISPECIES: pseudoazurin [Caulobacter]ENZ81914.1 pseudoazurin [Caulobacter vibrioides OR37]MBQ1559571.1 pseudoazurin [Caulobacter sp.]
MFKSVFIAGLVGLTMIGGAASATELQVKMRNQGAEGPMVFEPSTAKLKVGDTIRFTPADPGHNVESIPGLAPAGVAPVKGVIGKEVVVKVAKPGVYGFKCFPHWSMGMVFVAKVGDAKLDPAVANATLASAPPLTKRRLTAAFNAIK